MKRYRQTLDDLLEQLSPVDTSWRDAHADRVIEGLRQIPRKPNYTRSDLLQLLETEYTPEDMVRGARLGVALRSLIYNYSDPGPFDNILITSNQHLIKEII